MKKLFQWLTGSVVKEIGNAVDKLTKLKKRSLLLKSKL